jgi:cell division protein ZapA
MNARHEVLTIQLLNRSMQLKTTPEKAEELQKAGNILNAKMHEIQDKKLTTGNERIALMAALELAYELVATKKQKDLYLDSLSSRIQELQHRIENSLAPKTGEIL